MATSNAITPTFPVEIAIQHICVQHRNLARVFKCMEAEAPAIVEGTCSPAFTHMAAMLHYIDVFSGQIHHPAEEKYLFAAMRQNGTPDHITELAIDAHRAGTKKLAALQSAFPKQKDSFSSQYAHFLELLPGYIAFESDHMAYEESIVLPSAIDVLPAENWVQIADAFCSHNDPLFGVHLATEFAPLHRLLFPE